MKDHFPKRLGCYVTGLFLLAFGVAFSVKADMGVSPVNAIPYILSLIFDIDQGRTTTYVFCGYVLMQILILRKDYKPWNLIQIATSTMFGYIVTFSKFLWAWLPAPETYTVRFLFLFISILFAALGIMVYLSAEVISQPAEGAMLAVVQKTGIEFPKMKIIFDSVATIIASIISMLIFKRLVGVGIGTIIAAYGIGKVLAVLNKAYKPRLVALLQAE